MRFEWDENKRQSNMRKHGYDFADAETVFRSFIVQFEDIRHDYGEERWIAYGLLGDRS